jgi:5'-methylthioadenosine phosphorylase
MSDQIALGVIGGSGFYELPGLDDIEDREVDTPFGRPSSTIRLGTLNGIRVAFLARHGKGHVLSPSEIPYRANILALKMLGVGRILSISACGSLREDFRPGEVVVPDQLLDRTLGRPRSFFGDGLVGHLSTPDPFCPDLGPRVCTAVERAGGVVHIGGTLITIEGPRFSTRAESKLYRSWGMEIIGMTTAPEAFLAREAEICYTVMAHVTDYDVWHTTAEPVTVEAVIRTLQHNTELARSAFMHLIQDLPPQKTCECERALAGALITEPSQIPVATRSRLQPLIGKYLAN